MSERKSEFLAREIEQAANCCIGDRGRELLEKSLSRALELGALAMRRQAGAICGTETESLLEGIMTDAGLSRADKKAMNHQVVAIQEIERMIDETEPLRAFRYASYITPSPEREEFNSIWQRPKE